MYQTFCQTLFHMTWTAAVAALAVMALRLALRKVPRCIVCALWLVVFLRMVCPVGFTLPVSLVPEAPQVPLPVMQTASEASAGQGTGLEALPVTEGEAPASPETVPAEQALDPYGVLFVLWLAGFAGMLLWGGVSYALLRRRIADAVRTEDNVYVSDRIDSPFVCGLLRPSIYLPVGLSEADKRYVLLHEQAHIARGDHWTRLLAWLALSLHWFNPLLWAAYRLYGRDVETACDQRVIRDFDRTDVAGYAAALFHLGRRNSAPRAVPLAFGEENAKGRIRHVMDFKHPRRLVLLLAAVVCVIVGVLLLVDPGERNDQLDGVQVTEIRVLDRGVPVDLPEDLGHDIIPLIRQYDKGDYSDLLSYQSAAGDVVLSDQGGGTVFYLTASLDRELVLVRNNHDGYSWSSARKGLTLTGLKDDPDYRVWAEQVKDYLTTGRADELYALRTPYIGNHVAVGNILKALDVSKVVGPYTIELQTAKEPYGITLHLEDFPALEEDRQRTQVFLGEAAILFTALVDNASFFHWDYTNALDGTGGGIQPGLKKPVDRDDFQTLYDSSRETLGRLWDLAAGETLRYSLGETLYLSPEMEWRDFPMYLGNVTASKDLFSVQMSHALSSTWPQIDEVYVDPIYHREEAPDQIILQDDTWPTRKYLELTPDSAGSDTAADTHSGVLLLDSYTNRSLLAIFDSRNQITPYCLYQLDDQLWLCRRTFSNDDGGTWKADWVFRLTDQPPLVPNETEE